MDNNGWNEGQNQYSPNRYGPDGYGPNGGSGQNGAKSNAMGIASMVLGILSIVLICCCYIMSIPLGLAAVIFGIVSIKKDEPHRGYAIAGIITGDIGFIFSVAILILVIYMMETGIYYEIMNELYHEMGIDPRHMFK